MSDKTGKIERLLAEAKADAEEKTSVSAAERQFADAAAAEKTFRRLREKLFLVDLWNVESGVMSFALFNDNGERMPDKRAAVGDFIRIKLPGTGKDDWVKIINFYEGSNEVILTVQPTFDPTENTSEQRTTSHFFTGDATNNLCLRLGNASVEMFVIGLNEVTNTEESKNLIESARNLATANLGHYLGFQTAEWTTFCNNFLEKRKATES